MSSLIDIHMIFLTDTPPTPDPPVVEVGDCDGSLGNVLVFGKDDFETTDLGGVLPQELNVSLFINQVNG